jgi:hypothetical protein
MIQVRSTPPEVAEWLRPLATTPHRVLLRPTSNREQTAQFEHRAGDPIAISLLTDDRMENLWAIIGCWPGALDLTKMCVSYSDPVLLDELQEPSGRRVSFAVAQNHLVKAAKDFEISLKVFSGTAARLWGGPIEDLVNRLRKFIDAASGEARERERWYEFIPEPRPGGRGDPCEIVFRAAIAKVLEVLVEHYDQKITQAKQDEIVAILVSVVFDREVDVQTVRRHRERQKTRQQRGQRPN